MRPLRILTINACNSAEGDVNMLLLAFDNLDAEAFRLYAASAPRGTVFEKLSNNRNVRVIPMELGGGESCRPTRFGKSRRRIDTITALPQLVAFILREKIDVIYTIDRTVAPHLARVASHLTSRPFILSAQYPFYPKDSRSNRLVVNQATRVQVASDYLRSHLEPYVADTARMIKVPNAIQFEKYNHNLSGSTVRQQLGIDAIAPIVVMAGRLSPFKGQGELIDAANEILKRRPDTHFVIVGHDTTDAVYTHGPHATSFKAILEHRIAMYGIGRRVHIVDYVPDLCAAIAAANVSTMPSWEEPFGLVALEAMAMAKPVVATHAGGVPEFVADGQTGLLIPPRDPQALARALLALIDDPERARIMGLKGRERVEKAFTAQRYANDVGNVLNSAFQGRKHSKVG